MRGERKKECVRVRERLRERERERECCKKDRDGGKDRKELDDGSSFVVARGPTAIQVSREVPTG